MVLSPAAANVIAGNGADAIGCTPSLSGAVICNGILNYVAENTRIQGNQIGVDAAGQSLGNAGEGVLIARGASNTLVGVDVDDLDERNVISGNGRNGIVIAGGADNRVSGNRIGTLPAGNAAALVNPGAPNRIGVLVTETDTGQGAADTRVGGAGVRGNLISGNRIGVRVFGKATGTLLQGNSIGTNAAGTAAVPNTEDGVDLAGSSGGGIGTGGLSEYSNLISGNGRHGVRIKDTGTAQTMSRRPTTSSRATGSAPPRTASIPSPTRAPGSRSRTAPTTT